MVFRQLKTFTLVVFLHLRLENFTMTNILNKLHFLSHFGPYYSYLVYMCAIVNALEGVHARLISRLSVEDLDREV